MTGKIDWRMADANSRNNSSWVPTWQFKPKPPRKAADASAISRLQLQRSAGKTTKITARAIYVKLNASQQENVPKINNNEKWLPTSYYASKYHHSSIPRTQQKNRARVHKNSLISICLGTKSVRLPTVNEHVKYSDNQWWFRRSTRRLKITIMLRWHIHRGMASWNLQIMLLSNAYRTMMQLSFGALSHDASWL